MLIPISIHMISLIISAAALFLPSFGYVAVTHSPGPDCYDFFIPVNDATSLNRQIEDHNLTTTASVDGLLASLAASVNTSTYTAVTASFNISARYCEPEVKIPSRALSIQFLVHGITYTKDYWSALGFPGYDSEIYSWIKYASRRGYPTLSIDRLGYGDSSRPDPFRIDQNPMQAAVLNQIMLGLKAGDVAGRQFSKVIYVGHSQGSIIGEAVAATYPDSADCLILTGYSAKVSAVVLTTDPLPAALFSSRFADLNTGYVVTPNASTRELVLYGQNGTFDPKVAELDFQTQNTVSIGELVTGSSPPLGPLAMSFTGPVTVITGEQDAVFCYVNATIRGHCGQGDDSLPSQVREFFPNASSFSYFIPENIGHDINLHYEAHIPYAYAHDWLESHGF